jgi:uncharacterized damage-inducible protein DinB
MFLSEFDREMAATRKMLERVPEEKFTWKPHEKSSTLGKLANHIAAIPARATIVLTGRSHRPVEAASQSQLLEIFDTNVAACRAALANAKDDDLSTTIFVTRDVAKPRGDILRTWMMNHLIHHRGQLSVYLRLLDAPVHGVYGPSADEK